MTGDEAERLRMDPGHWTLGVVYHCKQDPRVIVRNRWFFGWTWNFGHPLAFVVLILFVAVFLAPILVIAPMVDASRAELALTYVIVFAAFVGISHYIAGGPR